MKVARIFGAVLDLNGVVINDERLHDAAWLNVANRGRRVKLTANDIHRNAGLSTLAMARILCPKAKDIQAVVDAKNYLYEQSLRRQLDIDPNSLKVPGVCEFIRQLHDECISLALNTSSPESEAKLILEAFGILPYFRAVLTQDDVQTHKPDPEGYILAAQGVGLKPPECAGFEDSIPGLRSLKAAGYGVIVAVGSMLAEDRIRAECPWITRYIPDFSKFTLNELSGLFCQA